VVNEVGADQLVERHLPVAVLARNRKRLDGAVDTRPELGQLALDVEDERLLGPILFISFVRNLRTKLLKVQT
jgi:short-subunit dehydrogenase involved in D-alanine esterification of teichoic acids